MATAPHDDNPYVGPRPFERADSQRFFGRDQEAADLVAQIVVHRAVILYAPSGAGKTSLLNARVIPLLERKGFETLPVARVQGPADATGATNPYTFNALMSIAGPDAEPADLAGQSLADYLGSQPHFEDKYGLAAPRLLIFDQFEELFTTYPDRWPQREAFFAGVEAALAADPLLRVLFSLREDYVAQLDSYASYLPAATTARYRLERMRPAAALDAIHGPLQGTGRAFAPEAAEQLVADLCAVRVEAQGGVVRSVAGQFVEPVQLQVVCNNLWRELPAAITTITSEHIATYGDVGEALADFYRRALQQTVAETGIAERGIRRWFEEALITPAGTRGTVYRGQADTGGLANPAVDALEDEHVIRGEWRAGSRWYELTHDRLIEPIEASNRAYDEARRELWLRRFAYGAGTLVLVLLALLIGSYALREPPPVGPSGTSEAVAVLESELATTNARGATAAAVRATSDAVATAQAEARATEDAAATRQMQTRAAADALATGTASAYAPTATAESRLAAVSANVTTALAAYNAAQNDPQASADERAAAQERLYAAQTELFAVRFALAGSATERRDALVDLLAVDPRRDDPGEGRAAELFYSLPPTERLGVLASLFTATEGLRDGDDAAAYTLFFALSQAQQVAFFAELPARAVASEALETVVAALVPVFGRPEGGEVLGAMRDALETAGAAPELRAFLAVWAAGREQAAAGSFARAIDTFGEAIRLEPGQAVPYIDRAAARLQAGDDALAVLADLEAVAKLTGAAPGSSTRLPLVFAFDRLYDSSELLVWMGNTFVCGESRVQRALASGRGRFPVFGRMLINEPFRFFVWPTEYPGEVTQAYNVNPEYYRQFGLTGHEGVDFRAPQGSELYAVAPGIVNRVRLASEGHIYGNAVYIEHWACDGVYSTVYAHMNDIAVQQGQVLAAGELLGHAGSTGTASGALLHLSLRKDGATARGETAQPLDIVDPSPFLTPWLRQSALPRQETAAGS